MLLGEYGMAGGWGVVSVVSLLLFSVLILPDMNVYE